MTGIWEGTLKRWRRRNQGALCACVHTSVYFSTLCIYITGHSDRRPFFNTEELVVCLYVLGLCLVRFTISLCVFLLTVSIYVVSFLHTSPAGDKKHIYAFPNRKADDPFSGDIIHAVKCELWKFNLQTENLSLFSFQFITAKYWPACVIMTCYILIFWFSTPWRIVFCS